MSIKSRLLYWLHGVRPDFVCPDPAVPNSEDVLIWPNGVWCHRCDRAQLDHLGDDFEVLKVSTQAWQDFLDHLDGAPE